MNSDDISASYTRYTPGAGGGMGIDFFFEFQDSLAGVQVQSLVINDVELEAHVVPGSPLKITANRFYSTRERSVDNPNPGSPEAPLYYASEYRAVLVLEKDGETQKFVINDFKENDMIMYP